MQVFIVSHFGRSLVVADIYFAHSIKIEDAFLTMEIVEEVYKRRGIKRFHDHRESTLCDERFSMEQFKVKAAYALIQSN